MSSNLNQLIQEYINESMELRTDLMNKVAALESELSTLKERPVEKTASVTVEEAEAVVNKLIEAGQLTSGMKKEAVAAMVKDSKFPLKCLDKIATVTIQKTAGLSSIGKATPVVQKTSELDSEREWKDRIAHLSRFQ